MSEQTDQLIEWMVVHGYAKNTYNAASIVKLLELDTLPRFWVAARRVIIYRRWKLAGSNTQEAARRAKELIALKKRKADHDTN